MINRSFMRLGYIKSLFALCVAMQLSACSSEEDGGEGGQSAVGINEGSTTVRWVAPASRSNGDPLSLADISSYRVHYGLQSRQYTNQVNVNDGSATQVTVSDKRGFYFFAVTTVDTSGRESEFSPEFERTL